MSADSLLNYLTQGLYVFVFAVTGLRAIRQPLRATLDTALFFGALALIIAESWVFTALGVTPHRWIGASAASVLMALPYIMLRLVGDFDARPVPAWLRWGGLVGVVLSVAALFNFSTLPIWLTLLLVLYFVGLEAYCAYRFLGAARRSKGVTSRRLVAVALGTGCLGLVILLAGLQAALPQLNPLWAVTVRLSGLASGLCYYLGFAPPAWLRHAWQEPELRAFLGRAASLPRLPETAQIVQALEDGARQSIGAQGATVGLWDDATQTLVFHVRTPGVGRNGQIAVPSGEMIAGRCFAAQRPLFCPDAICADPAHAEIYRRTGATAIVAAPVTAGQRRLGVLSVYAARAPIFADEDLELVSLLADQASVILESRALIDEASRVQAREEAARLKDDFLSAAAHDLKTPLTTLVAQAQLLVRRGQRDPAAPADLGGLERIARESLRLRELVLDLLDASRAEQGGLLAKREAVDLAALARQTGERVGGGRCVLDAPAPVVAEVDEARVAQLIENLLDNALKYSPGEEPVAVSVWRDREQARLAVSDRGIGVPPGDLEHVFGRFYRAGNVDDRRYAGMGLGLYICQAIVSEHGGRIWVESGPAHGPGSTFHVGLPVEAPALLAEGAGVEVAP